MTMHPYIRASLELELRVQKGEHFATALHAVSKSYMFTQGERQLITSCYMERKARGKKVRPVNQWGTRDR